VGRGGGPVVRQKGTARFEFFRGAAELSWKGVYIWAREIKGFKVEMAGKLFTSLGCTMREKLPNVQRLAKQTGQSQEREPAEKAIPSEANRQRV